MIITSIILSVLALLLSMWMGRRNPVRSSGLTAGMLLLLMLSPLFLWMPKIHVDLPWAVFGTTEVAEVVREVDHSALSESAWSLMYLSMWVYGVGCVVLLTKLSSHFMVVRRWCSEALTDKNAEHQKLLKQCAEQLRLKKLPELRFSDRVNSPVITGLFHPILLLPVSASAWSSETLKMVMLHELGHVKRRDLWTNLVGQIACAIHWFNPLVWILRKRLTHECEYACDAHVISTGAHPGNYINALCDVAESCHETDMLNSRKSHSLAFSAALSMANQASLKNRVQNLLEKKAGANTISSLMVMAILTISTSAAVAINLVRPDEKPVSHPVSLETDRVEEMIFPDQTEVNLRLSANPFPGE